MNYFDHLYSLFGLLCVLCLLSCQPKVSRENIQVFHYNQHNNITSLDPAFAKSQNNIWAVNHLFSTIVQLNDDLDIIPGVARSWTVTEDGLEYWFYIRDSVMFHRDPCFGENKTRHVVAEDVVYSLTRLLDSELNAPGSWIFKGKTDPINGFSALNDTTLVLRLNKPFSPLLSLLTMQYCSVVPKEAVEYYGSNFFRHPVGTGPFKFHKWVDNQGLFLLKNDEYYEWKKGLAFSNVDIVRTSFIGERSIALLELLNGRIDLFSGLESSYVNTVLDAQGNLRSELRNIQFIKAPYLNFEYIGINYNAPGAHPLLSDESFRKALNLSINRSIMLSTLRNNVGVPADAGVITRGLPAYNPSRVKGYGYEVDKALQIVRRFPAELLKEELVIHTSPDYLDLTTYIARQWEDIGLSVRIEVMESASLRDAMRRGQVALFRASWIADYPDGESFLSMFYSQNPPPPNYTRFSNPSFDRLYETSLQETQPGQKIELYQQMDQLLIEQAPVIFLFYDEVALFTSDKINGISRNALNLLQVKNLMAE